MKRFLTLLLVSALALPLAGCGAPQLSGSGREPSRPQDSQIDLARLALVQPDYPDFPQFPQEDGPDWEAYTAAHSEYAAALRQLRGDGVSPDTVQALASFAGRSTALALAGQAGQNAVYSPLSLWSALAMLAQCAGGSSRDQVLSALGADSMDQLQDQVSQVWRGLYTDDGASALLLGNSIWLNSAAEGTYVQETLDALARDYYAGAYSVPMGTSQADEAVTAWVGEQTRGLIGSGGPVVETRSETLALLAASLYYKAAWQSAFSAGSTYEDTFTAADGTQSQVEFMHQTDSGALLQGGGYQAAALATRLGEVVFLLPDEGTSPEELLQREDLLASLDFSGEQVQTGEIRWSVPKFDVSSDLDLLSSLEQLGVTDLLRPEAADLSALTSLDAYLSGARQMARVTADEEGVEAAAVTILTVDATSAVADPQPMVMDLDRPFLFVIRNEGVPLFVGVVHHPTGP